MNECSMLLLCFQCPQLAFYGVSNCALQQPVIAKIRERARERKEFSVPEVPGCIFRPLHGAPWSLTRLFRQLKPAIQGIEEYLEPCQDHEGQHPARHPALRPTKQWQSKWRRTHPPAHFCQHRSNARPRKSRLDDQAVIRSGCGWRNQRNRANCASGLNQHPQVVAVVIAVNLNV